MSDYLGNLVARSLAPTAGVQPRLASIFEPSPTGLGLKSELGLEQETLSEPPPAAHQAEKLSAAPLENPTPAQSVSPGPEPIAPQIPVPKRKAHVSEEPGPSSEEPVRSSTFRQQDERHKSPRKESPVEPVEPMPRESESRVRRLETIPGSSRREEALIPNPQRSTLNSQPNSQSFLKPTATITTTPTVRSVLPAIRALKPVPPTPPPTPAPTINVTIGRVEIRAASPPAPQRAKAKPASALSLEDYLRQRANGGKR